jgi:hypothetical protein
MSVVEYSFILIAITNTIAGVVCFKAIKEVSQITKDMQSVITAISGKSREYGEVKAIDKAYESEEKKEHDKGKVVKKILDDTPEDMLL